MTPSQHTEPADSHASTTTTQTEDNTDLSVLEGNAIMFDVLKGGCGKSALSLNLADRLSERNNDVLYLDLDPNGHISFALGYDDAYYDEMHDYGYVTLDEKLYAKESLTPHDMIFDTDFGFDFVPSYDDMESFEAALDTYSNASTAKEEVLAKYFLHPLFENGEYDYFIMDGGGERSNIADNGFYAGKTAIVPLTPGEESLSAWRRTWNRVIKPLQPIGFEILAVVPNLLSKRIDHENDDRVLLNRLNNAEVFDGLIPEFAQFTDEEFEAIDNGGDYTLPGIREREGISGGVSNAMPAAHYADDCDQIKHFDALADIVEQGGIHNGER